MSKRDEAAAAALIRQVDELLAELDIELDDLAHGRRRTTTNACLQGIAVGLRLRLARRCACGPITTERITALEARWRARLEALARFEAADVASAL